MANADVKFLSSGENWIKTTKDFELNVKEKLRWSRSYWIESGESGSRINKLCNSVNYWKHKLKPAMEDTSIIITLFNAENNVTTSLFRIVEAIEKLDINVNVLGFTNFRNPRYICIYFKSKEERDKVKANFKMMENSFVFYMSWAFELEDSVTSLKVHWLPMTLDIKIIEKELENYVKCVDHQRSVLSAMSGREFISGKVSFKVNIKKGVKIETIPHIMTINNMEALVTIPGRQPLCLNCDRLGHISRDCKLRYCNACKELKVKEHECGKSITETTYAGKLKSGNTIEKPEEWGDTIIIDKISETVRSHEVLSNEIIRLEKQIGALQEDDKVNIKSRLEHKRKADHININKNGEESEREENQYSLDADDSSDDSVMDEDSTIDFINNQDQTLLNKKEDKVEGGENSDLGINCNIKSNKKKNKKSNKTLLKELGSKVVESNGVEPMRSYGRPVYRNARRIKEEKAFLKLHEKSPDNREFLFKD